MLRRAIYTSDGGLMKVNGRMAFDVRKMIFGVQCIQ